MVCNKNTLLLLQKQRSFCPKFIVYLGQDKKG
jgi:hypothetical protein